MPHRALALALSLVATLISPPAAHADWFEGTAPLPTLPSSTFADPTGLGSTTLDPVDTTIPPGFHEVKANGTWNKSIDPTGSANVMTIDLAFKEDGWSLAGGGAKTHYLTFDKTEEVFETSPGVYAFSDPGGATSLGTFTGLGNNSGVSGGPTQVISGFTFKIAEFDPSIGTLSKVGFLEGATVGASDGSKLEITLVDSLTLEVTLAPGEELIPGGSLDADDLKIAIGATLTEGASADWVDGTFHPFSVTVTPTYATVVVPEPGSLALLLGLGPLALWRRRRQSSDPAGASGAEAPA